MRRHSEKAKELDTVALSELLSFYDTYVLREGGRRGEARDEVRGKAGGEVKGEAGEEAKGKVMDQAQRDVLGREGVDRQHVMGGVLSCGVQGGRADVPAMQQDGSQAGVVHFGNASLSVIKGGLHFYLQRDMRNAYPGPTTVADLTAKL